MKPNILTIILILMIIILLYIYYYIYYNKYNIESFDNAINGVSFQTGTSNITPTGTITFKTPFVKPPIIFTQIIGTSSTSTNAYSVQIFDVTATNFNYSKNKLYNDIIKSEDMQDANMLTLGTSALEPFTWIAIG